MSGVTPLLTTLGLVRSPFPPAPDAGSYFFTPHLQEQFAEVRHCIEARKGFVLLTGEVGLGKSTLVRRLLDTLPEGETCSALVFNTFLQGSALLAAVVRDFGLEPDADLDRNLALLNAFLMDRHREGKTCLLVIDDAQNLTVESLEVVRLLCNLETGQEKLLQILLVGQPELEAVLSAPELRQLKSRIIKHARLRGLREDEVGRYFEFRINAAGGSGRISLAPSAAQLLHRSTGGNLRQIHLVLDRCLYGLAARNQWEIDRDLLQAAVQDVSLPAETSRSGRRWGWMALVGASALTGAALVSAAQWWSPAPVQSAARATQAAEGPVLAAPVAPASAPIHAASGAQSATAAPLACYERVRQQATPAGRSVIVSQPLPEPLEKIAADLGGVCTEKLAGVTWATWQANPLIAEAWQSQASSATRLMQEKLAQRGLLEPQFVDGMGGPRTRAALQSFQQSLGLPVTGHPDELTFMLLEKLHGA
ncbi:ExeA family protein [Acidovorax sp. DW039]|uniref:ExeA family protein n=1 Tax=Acidovorax sp. DW039 TaxID=3095606 RepID=UPI0030919B24|nr:ExeA family protein [Acidovorax sp. DW039]